MTHDAAKEGESVVFKVLFIADDSPDFFGINIRGFDDVSLHQIEDDGEEFVHSLSVGDVRILAAVCKEDVHHDLVRFGKLKVFHLLIRSHNVLHDLCLEFLCLVVLVPLTL